MPTSIVLPASMENGTLARWLKTEGDFVRVGDVLAEVETDKTMLEIESLQEGYLTQIRVPQGTSEVLAGTVLAVLTSPAEKELCPEPAISAAPSAHAPSGSAEIHELRCELMAAMKSNGGAEHGERIFASPRARYLAGKAGIDLSGLRGSGPRGRIIERDVEAAGVNHSGVEVPHDSMRRSIARRLLESKQTVPHFYLSVDCELDALLAAKEQLNRRSPASTEGGAAHRTSLNDFIIKAWAMALALVPEANVCWTENAMLKHREVDVAVAVSVPGGLITPIVRRAESKTLLVISREMRDLSTRASARKLKPEEYDGGTTTVSNLGMLGVRSFAAIVNPPHATILAVGAGEKRAIVRKDALGIATIMSCTLSADHRAVDGAVGAHVLAEFKHFVENPVAMFV
jgi:pyruvate dehydrogenase E2 component (dihydrolipoamide acetyltransferase)